MLNLTSNTIQDFPFELYADCNDSQLEDLAKSHYLSSMNSWMLPQIAHHFGQWKLEYDSQGKIDPNLTAKRNIGTPWGLGLWKVCTKLRRGSLIKSQIHPEFASYSALVPLIPMGLKKYRGIKYSDWAFTPDTKLLDKNLREAMFWRPDDDLCDAYEGLIYQDRPRFGMSTARLLELRKQGLTVRTGPKAGTMSAPTSSWCLRNIRNTELARAPKLVGTMLTQIWVAHPSIRTEYMILDPQDWDAMPEPLVTGDVLKPTAKVTREYETDLPWEA